MIVLAAALAALAAKSAVAVTVDPSHRLVEGVAYDSKTIWVSSVLDRQILSCTITCKTLATLPAGLHPLGIAWDKAHQRLWVAADCPDIPGVEKCARGALIALDRAGKLRARLVPLGDSFHPGDVSADRGRVFVGDSQNGALYSLRYDSRELTPVVKPSDKGSAQGSALDAAGTSVLAADYGRGLGMISLKDGTRTALEAEGGVKFRGLDGIARCGDAYFAIYNGRAPYGLLRIEPGQLNSTYEQIDLGGALTDPTQLAFDGKRLLVVANAGWEAAAKGAARTDQGATVLSIPIGKDCRPE